MIADQVILLDKKTKLEQKEVEDITDEAIPFKKRRDILKKSANQIVLTTIQNI